MDCVIKFDVRHKVGGFLWETTSTSSARVTYDDLHGKNVVTGHIDGPNHNAISAKTTYTFSDAEYGSCTWTITAN